MGCTPKPWSAGIPSYRKKIFTVIQMPCGADAGFVFILRARSSQPNEEKEMSEPTPEQYRDLIKDQREIIRKAHARIDELAEAGIPNYHFLDHQVWPATWECDKSPIGMCVWDVSEKGFHIDCNCCYCGEPVERK